MLLALPRAFQPPDLKPRVALAKSSVSSFSVQLRAKRGVQSLARWVVGIWSGPVARLTIRFSLLRQRAGAVGPLQKKRLSEMRKVFSSSV